MPTLFGDETDDGHTYALGGWRIMPIHYDIFTVEWNKMLGTIRMPDGSACPGFHASLMMNQRGPFAGWTKDQAFDPFDKATSVLADRPGRFSIRPSPPRIARGVRSALRPNSGSSSGSPLRLGRSAGTCGARTGQAVVGQRNHGRRSS